jgi:hypothetical protein
MKLGNVEFTTAPLRRNPLSSLKKESGLILKKIIAEWLGEKVFPPLVKRDAPDLVLEQTSGDDKEYLDFNMPPTLQFDSDPRPLHRKPGDLPPS